jgi:hypothetical protein
MLDPTYNSEAYVPPLNMEGNSLGVSTLPSIPWGPDLLLQAERQKNDQEFDAHTFEDGGTLPDSPTPTDFSEFTRQISVKKDESSDKKDMEPGEITSDDSKDAWEVVTVSGEEFLQKCKEGAQKLQLAINLANTQACRIATQRFQSLHVTMAIEEPPRSLMPGKSEVEAAEILNDAYARDTTAPRDPSQKGRPKKKKFSFVTPVPVFEDEEDPATKKAKV